MKFDNQNAKLTIKKSTLLGSKIFSISDQMAFAEASGDFNPIHINSIAARRFLYGECVVHGIHGLLWALDLVSIKSNFTLEEVKVVFKKPIFLNKIINCYWNKKVNIIKLFSSSNLLAEISIKVVKKIKNNTHFSIGRKKRLKDPLKTNMTELKVNTKHSHYFHGSLDVLNKLFPIFLKKFGENLLIETAALSEIVGMQVPGLNSLFISAHIKYEKKKEKPYFLIENLDKRFGLVNLLVRAYNSKCKLSAVYRPEIVDVPKIKYINKNIKIEKNEFKNCKALIIGGSRGLGAWVAKILAAGKGQSTITYVNGLNEAKSIEKDINFSNKLCHIKYLNIKNKFIFDLSSYNQIYYFASPKIMKSYKKKLDKRLYNKYYKYYVLLFEKILDEAKLYKNIKAIFYPSTVFLNTQEEGFKEYLKAKNLGEELCKKTNLLKKMMVIYSRLPKMETDQTSSLVKTSNADPVKILTPLIRQLKKQIEN